MSLSENEESEENEENEENEESEENDSLWNNFSIEIEECLDQVETLLINAESEEIDKDNISHLFRSFHSLKGAFRMLALLELGTIAHACEDILGLIREEITTLNLDLISLLLEAFDLLKNASRIAVQTRQDTPISQNLLNVLKQTFQTLSVKPEVSDEQKSQQKQKQLFLESIKEEIPYLVTMLDQETYRNLKLYEKLSQALAVFKKTAEDMKFDFALGLALQLDMQLPLMEQGLPDSLQKELKTLLESLDILGQTPPKEISQDQDQDQDQDQSPNPKTVTKAVSSPHSQTLRIDKEQVDQFMNQLGEIVLTQSMLNHTIHDKETQEALLSLKNITEEGSLHETTAKQIIDHVETLTSNQFRITQIEHSLHTLITYLQEQLLELRVVPIETVFHQFPRLVRDLAKTQRKKIKVEMEGEEVKIDKSMVELISDPLMHMVRNSVDHGIELPMEREVVNKPRTATITLKANQKGNQVLVSIADDGKGIDPEKIRAKAVEKGLLGEAASHRIPKEEILDLIFTPGFSTASKVTDVSGRGVGMDIVRNGINRLGGEIQIDSEIGWGTTFTLRLPLSVATQEALMVKVNQQTFAVPDRYIAEVFQSSTQEIQSIKGHHSLLLRGAFLPIFHLGGLLGYENNKKTMQNEEMSLVVLSNRKKRIGIEVDSMLQRQELFIKDIHPHLAALPGVGGVSILGDGKVVLILDGEELFELAEKIGTRANRYHETPVLS